MDSLFFIEPSYIGYMWLIIGIVFLVAEMATPGMFFFIAFAIGSCFAGLTAFLGYSLIIQCIVALVCSIFSFFILRHYFALTSKRKIKTKNDALVGQKGIVRKTIESHKAGLVKVNGEIWTAEVEKGVILQEGTVVTVVTVKGNRLIVQ